MSLLVYSDSFGFVSVSQWIQDLPNELPTVEIKEFGVLGNNYWAKFDHDNNNNTILVTVHKDYGQIGYKIAKEITMVADAFNSQPDRLSDRLFCLPYVLSVSVEIAKENKMPFLRICTDYPRLPDRIFESDNMKNALHKAGFVLEQSGNYWKFNNADL